MPGGGSVVVSRWVAPVVAALVGVLVIGALVTDLVGVSTLHRTQGVLAATRHGLAVDTAHLAARRHSVAAATAQLDTRQADAATTLESLIAAHQRLVGAQGAASLQQLDVATLDTCLTGVMHATASEAGGDTQAAVDAITGASAACTALDAAQSASGIAYPFDFPDPFVLTVGSEYYAYATNSAAGNIQIIESSDLAHWTTVGDALPHVAAWAKPGATWAPSVLHLGDTYVLYYSAVFLGTGEQCISAATASQPQGPFTDTSTIPVACQLTDGGSIDPSPYVDASGTPYLTWKSEGGGGRPPTIWAQQLGPDGTGLLPGAPTALLQPTVAWQGGVVEGPDMVDLDGQYELFYSGNDWSTAGYAVGVAACVGPLGPCPPSDAPPVLSSGASFSGPGGASVFTDAQGTVWMAFHAWLPGEVGFPHSRVLFLRRVTITAGVPTVEP